MGNCHTGDESLKDKSDKIDELIKHSLAYIEGIMMVFLSKRNYGAVVKLMKIQEACQEHYEENSKIRKDLIAKENRIDRLEFNQAEKSLAKEMQIVNKLLRTLTEMHREICDQWFSSTVEQVIDFISSVEEEFGYKLLRIQITYEEMKEKNREIDHVALETNHGIPLSEKENEFIQRLSRETTLMFIEKARNVVYPRTAQRRWTYERTGQDASYRTLRTARFSTVKPQIIDPEDSEISSSFSLLFSSEISH